MARLTGNFDFTGKLGNISAYKINGTGKTVLRTKGGASKHKIKHHPAFINTRRNNAEFGGASMNTLSEWGRRAVRFSETRQVLRSSGSAGLCAGTGKRH